MGDDRRRDPRQPAEQLRARVKFADRRQFERCYTKDISRGGIFLRTSKPSPLDSPIEVTLELPGAREVKLHGVVVHCVPPDQAGPGQQAGLGVQFSDLTSRVRQGLEGILAELSSPLIAAPAPPLATGAPLVAPGRAAPAVPGPPAVVPEFEERKTDPRGARQTAPEALIPEEPIIEEEFDARATPRAGAAATAGVAPGRARPGTGATPAVAEPPATPRVSEAAVATPEKPARPPTPFGVRAVPAPGPSKATVETLRRMLWACASPACLAGRSYYEVIGVGATAGTIEVQAACEAMRRAFDLDHPPQALARDAVERVAAVVTLIGEIEQCLCDARRRAEYDGAASREPPREPER